MNAVPYDAVNGRTPMVARSIGPCLIFESVVCFRERHRERMWINKRPGGAEAPPGLQIAREAPQALLPATAPTGEGDEGATQEHQRGRLGGDVVVLDLAIWCVAARCVGG